MSEGKNEKGKGILSGIAALLTSSGIAIGHSMENTEKAFHSLHLIDEIHVLTPSNRKIPELSTDLPKPNFQIPKNILHEIGIDTSDVNLYSAYRKEEKIRHTAYDAAYAYISVHQDNLSLVAIKLAAKDAAIIQNDEQGHVLSDAAVTTIAAASATTAYIVWQNTHKG